jgi:hypothetical protein
MTLSCATRRRHVSESLVSGRWLRRATNSCRAPRAMHSTGADRRGLGENGAQPGLCFFDDLTHAGRSFSISVVVFVRSCPAQAQIFSSILLAPTTNPPTKPRLPPRDCYRDSSTTHRDSPRAPRRDTIAPARRAAHHPLFCTRLAFPHS